MISETLIPTGRRCASLIDRLSNAPRLQSSIQAKNRAASYVNHGISLVVGDKEIPRS